MFYIYHICSKDASPPGPWVAYDRTIGHSNAPAFAVKYFEDVAKRRVLELQERSLIAWYQTHEYPGAFY